MSKAYDSLYSGVEAFGYVCRWESWPLSVLANIYWLCLVYSPREGVSLLLVYMAYRQLWTILRMRIQRDLPEMDPSLFGGLPRSAMSVDGEEEEEKEKARFNNPILFLQVRARRRVWPAAGVRRVAVTGVLVLGRMGGWREEREVVDCLRRAIPFGSIVVIIVVVVIITNKRK